MNKTTFHRAAALAAAVTAVHVVVLIAVKGLALPLLAAALAASIVFGLVIATEPTPQAQTEHYDGHMSDIARAVSRSSKASAFFVLALFAVLIVLWPITAIFGQAADFYCSPVVPWRVEIAVFGAFVISILKHMAWRLRYANTLDVLIYLSLFWIAPFYGFFSAPYFLGISILASCPDRQVLEVVLAGAAMAVASALAEVIGAFLSESR